MVSSTVENTWSTTVRKIKPLSQSQKSNTEKRQDFCRNRILCLGADKELIVATTRPPRDTLADQAIAVHPKDKRYKNSSVKRLSSPSQQKNPHHRWRDGRYGILVLRGKDHSCTRSKRFETGKRTQSPPLDYRVLDNNGVWWWSTRVTSQGKRDGSTWDDDRDDSCTRQSHERSPSHLRSGYSERGGARVQTIVLDTVVRR